MGVFAQICVEQLIADHKKNTLVGNILVYFTHMHALNIFFYDIHSVDILLPSYYVNDAGSNKSKISTSIFY